MPGSSSSLVRLHKVLAEAGIGSRRRCEEIIQEGRVEVDGSFVTELGTSVDPAKQEILVDGQRIRVRRKQYFILNKPVGVVSTNFDQAGRTRVIDLVPQDERLFTIGRLDRQSEGLIIITNDGELANHLAHPRYGVAKTYHVEVAGALAVEEIKMIQSGVYIADGFVKAESCRLKRKLGKSSILEIVLREGKNREIRRLLAKVGHKVLRLKRISIGPLKLGDVPAGSFRELKPSEVKALRESSDASAAKGAPKRKLMPRRATSTSPDSRRTKKTTSKGAAYRGGKKKKSKRKSDQQPAPIESRRGEGRAVKQKQASKKKQMRRK
ncbi:pseudouridine synthase [Bremerella alba]|uniref:Pseudouridine synthase n=1 Tax=Bremerella alba TaxID=980252 RepID=A0A7V9A8E7_9BACT|nr:pseudouridine synthase [Bremerella alba]MBA2115971.1 hypothetical protein [Bremerella alba]